LLDKLIVVLFFPNIHPHTLYILAGPTAVGKTQLAIDWALRHNASILSADSTLFYQGMNIGTAKPSPSEQLLVHHFGIDVVPVHQPFSIKNYIDLAQTAIHATLEHHQPLLITGGSGFYLKAFFDAVIDDIQVSADIQQRIASLWEEGGLKAWLDVLHQHCPDGLGHLDIKNPRRVSKALGRVLATGLTVNQLEAKWKAQKSPFADYPKQVCILERPTPILHERIHERTRQMIDHGLVDEVRHLIEQGLLDNPIAASTIGYKETSAYLKGDIPTLNALEDMIALHTRQLVQKQRRFFKYQLPQAQVIDLG